MAALPGFPVCQQPGAADKGPAGYAFPPGGGLPGAGALSGDGPLWRHYPGAGPGHPVQRLRTSPPAACRRKYPLFMRGKRNIVISHNMEYNIDGGVVSAGDKARRRLFRNSFSFALPFSPIAALPAASASGGTALFMGSPRKISFFYIESSQMLWYNRCN